MVPSGEYVLLGSEKLLEYFQPDGIAAKHEKNVDGFHDEQKVTGIVARDTVATTGDSVSPNDINREDHCPHTSWPRRGA